MSVILLSVVTGWVLNSSNSQDLVNERFVAPREYYEELWQINCPKEVSERLIAENTLALCVVLDTRFEQQQTCDWWHRIPNQAHYSANVEALFAYCPAPL